jgi:hypothetical protein
LSHVKERIYRDFYEYHGSKPAAGKTDQDGREAYPDITDERI